MLADGVVILAFHYIERGMKAEKALQEMEAANEVQNKKESSKAESRAQKNAVRQEQKQVTKNQKHASGSGKGKHNIQQPNKKTS